MEETHQEGDEVIDSPCIRSCQKASPTANVDPAHHKAGDEADDQAEYEREEFQRRQSRLDGQPVYGDLQACSMELPRIDENDQNGE